MSASSRARAARGEFTAEARRIASARAAELQGLDVAVADLDTLESVLDGEEMVALVTEQTDLMHADAVSHAGISRFNQYRQAIKKKVFTEDPDGVKGTVFVVQGPWERDPAKKWPKNVPLWREWGTRKMAPRPHLLPAFNAARERMNRAVDRLLQRRVSS